MELGAGAGLVGVCLHRVGAGSVLLTDRDAQTLRNCRRNLEENGVVLGEDSRVSSRQGLVDKMLSLDLQPQPDTRLLVCTCQVQVQALDWAEHKGLEAEVIVGADLLYDPGALQLAPARHQTPPACADVR